jgi:hypothetical protein
MHDSKGLGRWPPLSAMSLLLPSWLDRERACDSVDLSCASIPAIYLRVGMAFLTAAPVQPSLAAGFAQPVSWLWCCPRGWCREQGYFYLECISDSLSAIAWSASPSTHLIQTVADFLSSF